MAYQIIITEEHGYWYWELWSSEDEDMPVAASCSSHESQEAVVAELDEIRDALLAAPMLYRGLLRSG